MIDRLQIRLIVRKAIKVDLEVLIAQAVFQLKATRMLELKDLERRRKAEKKRTLSGDLRLKRSILKSLVYS